MKTLSCLGVALVLAACGGVTSGGNDAAAKDARGDADTASKDAGRPPACTIPGYLTGDAGRAGGCFVDRALVRCDNDNGCTDICLSPSFTTCPDDGSGGASDCGSSSGPDTKPETCRDLCAAGEYAVECETAQGPNGGGATISPPASCHTPSGGAASAEGSYVCCPCGS